MITIWDVKLSQRANGRYHCRILSEAGRVTVGEGVKAKDAFKHAMMQHTVQPAIEWAK